MQHMKSKRVQKAISHIQSDVESKRTKTFPKVVEETPKRQNTRKSNSRLIGRNGTINENTIDIDGIQGTNHAIVFESMAQSASMHTLQRKNPHSSLQSLKNPTQLLKKPSEIGQTSKFFSQNESQNPQKEGSAAKPSRRTVVSSATLPTKQQLNPQPSQNRIKSVVALNQNNPAEPAGSTSLTSTAKKPTKKKPKSIVKDGTLFDSDISAINNPDSTIQTKKSIQSTQTTKKSNSALNGRLGSPGGRESEQTKSTSIPKQPQLSRKKSPELVKQLNSISRSTSPNTANQNAARNKHTPTSKKQQQQQHHANPQRSSNDELSNQKRQRNASPSQYQSTAQKNSHRQSQHDEQLNHHQSARLLYRERNGDQTPNSHHGAITANESIEFEEQRKEKIAKIKVLVEMNIRKGILEKQQKQQEKEEEERQKRIRQQQIAIKNQEIRDGNANRFSRQKTPSQDLARRLPWGINQEKLRNYAIQVLTQYRNSDLKQANEAEKLKKSFVEMYMAYQTEQKVRRQQIGLENLTEEEIQRLIQVDKEKSKILHQQSNYENGSSSSTIASPSALSNRTLKRRDQSNNDEILKRSIVLSYMESKKQQIEQDSLQTKMEEQQEKQRKKANQDSLQLTIRHIQKRIQKKLQQSQKQRQIRSKSPRVKPSSYNTLNPTGISRKKLTPSNSMGQIPTSSNQNINQYLSSGSRNATETHQQQQQHRTKTSPNTLFTEQDYTQQLAYLQHQINNNYYTHTNGGTLPPSQYQQYVQHNQMYNNNTYGETLPHEQYQLQQFNGMEFAQDEVLSDDFSRIYEEFKNLFEEEYQGLWQQQHPQQQQLLTQQKSPSFLNPSFYKSSSNHATQQSQMSSVSSKSQKQKTSKQKKQKKRGGSPRLMHDFQAAQFISGSQQNTLQTQVEQHQAHEYQNYEQQSHQQNMTQLLPPQQIRPSFPLRNQLVNQLNSISEEQQQKQYQQQMLFNQQRALASATAAAAASVAGIVQQQHIDESAISGPNSLNQNSQLNITQQRYDNLLQRFTQIKKGSNTSRTADQLIIDNQKIAQGPSQNISATQPKLLSQQRQNQNNQQQQQQFINTLEPLRNEVYVDEEETENEQNEQFQAIHQIYEFDNELNEEHEQDDREGEQQMSHKIHNIDSEEMIPDAFPASIIQENEDFFRNNSKDDEEEEVVNDVVVDDEQEDNHEEQVDSEEEEYKERFAQGSSQMQEEDQEEYIDEDELEQILYMQLEQAATLIQKVWRGYFIRKIFSHYQQMIENGGEEGYAEDQFLGLEEIDMETQETVTDGGVDTQIVIQQNEAIQVGQNMFEERQHNRDRNDDDDQAEILQGSPEPKYESMMIKESTQIIQPEYHGVSQQINKAWLLNQEKEEVQFIEEEQDSKNGGFPFEQQLHNAVEGDEGNDERIVHISTIKSSVVSNDEPIQNRQSSPLATTDFVNQIGSENHNNSDEKSEHLECYEDQITDNFDADQEMTEEDLENWIEVQGKIKELRTSEFQPQQRELVVQILLDLTPNNQNRLLAYLNNNVDDNDNLEQQEQEIFEEIEADENTHENDQQSQQNAFQGSINTNESLEESESQIKGNRNQDIEIEAREDQKHVDNQQNQLKNELDKVEIKLEKETHELHTAKSEEQENEEDQDVSNRNSDLQSESSKLNSKRENYFSSNFEALSERSFNQIRRNKFHSPKDKRYGMRSTLSAQSGDDTHSMDPVSPKEDLNQLYALLYQEQQIQMKKEGLSRSSNLSSKGTSLKNSARNLKKDLQLERFNEYYESSSTPVSEFHLAVALNNSMNNGGATADANSTTNGSIFVHNSFKNFTDKKMKQLLFVNIEESLQTREREHQAEKQKQLDELNKQKESQQISPRSYERQKNEIEQWDQAEVNDIASARQEFEASLLKESQKKTQRDLQFAQRFKANPISSKFDSRASLNSEEDLLSSHRKLDHEILNGTHVSGVAAAVNTHASQQPHEYSETHSDHSGSSHALRDFMKDAIPAHAPSSLQSSKLKINEQLGLSSDSLISASVLNEKDKKQNSPNRIVLAHDNLDKKSQESKFQKQSQRKKSDDSKSEKQLDLSSNSVVENDKKSIPNMAAAMNDASAKLLKNKMKLVMDFSDVSSGSQTPVAGDQKQKSREEEHGKSAFSLPPIKGAQKASDVQDLSAACVFERRKPEESDENKQDKEEAMSECEDAQSEEFDDLSDQETSQKNNNKQEGENQHSNKERNPIHTVSSLFSPSAEFMQERNEQYEEMQNKWRICGEIDQRISEQLDKQQSVDKSEQYGIPTNILVLTQYVERLFAYVIENHRDELIANLNTPFGFAPSKRLKLIHGYDTFNESIPTENCEEPSSKNLCEGYKTLPFVLSEDLFVQFEQKVIGNGETEKEQIMKEFEHIHNKSIFDTFNEALNIFRPFFSLGGPPYPWTISEKNLILGLANPTNLDFILEKSKTHIISWSSYLCGLVNEEEPPMDVPMLDENGNPPPLSVLLEHLTPQNEYLASVREDRLSKMLLTEIFENEYKWQLYEDERTEVVMELADQVFEHLIEEIANGMMKTTEE